MEIFNIKKDFGDTLKKYREARELSQEKFAEMCNISRAYYGRIERGEYNTTLEIIQKISIALGIKISELFQDLPY